MILVAFFDLFYSWQKKYTPYNPIITAIQHNECDLIALSQFCTVLFDSAIFVTIVTVSLRILA